MEIVKFIYCNKAYYFKDVLIFVGTTDFDKKYDEKRINEFYLKLIRDPNSYSCKNFKKLSDEQLLNNMVIKELPKPHTFPKFNNETPFLIKFNGKIIRNPQIIAIRWTGCIWEYRIKNIGHEYDFQPENSLEKINKSI